MGPGVPAEAEKLLLLCHGLANEILSIADYDGVGGVGIEM